MAAKINKTVKISLRDGAPSNPPQMKPDNPWHGGAGQTGMYDGVKRRGGKSPMTGSGYGTAKGIGGGAKTTTGGTRSGQDSDGY